jgi:hypothetical protein
MWFFDVVPVCPTFGYYLTNSVGKLDDRWDGASITFTVYSWERDARRPLIPTAVEYHDAPGDKLLKFSASVGTLVPNPGLLYRFNLGLVKISSRCDILVEVEVTGKPPSGGGRLVGAPLQILNFDPLHILIRNRS